MRGSKFDSYHLLPETILANDTVSFLDLSSTGKVTNQLRCWSLLSCGFEPAQYRGCPISSSRMCYPGYSSI